MISLTVFIPADQVLALENREATALDMSLVISLWDDQLKKELSETVSLTPENKQKSPL